MGRKADEFRKEAEAAAKIIEALEVLPYCEQKRIMRYCNDKFVVHARCPDCDPQAQEGDPDGGEDQD